MTAAVTFKPGFEADDGIEKAVSDWRAMPRTFKVAEYLGTGDPFFGGKADDRVLGEDGQIKPFGSKVPTAVFTRIEDAHAAARAIPNRRDGSVLGVIPTW